MNRDGASSTSKIAAASPDSGATVGATTEKLILNVNDSASNRYYVSRVLKAAGWRVIEAETGSDGIEQARAHRPDLIVLDVKLPDMSGHEVCRVIKSDPVTAHIRIIQTSATFVTSEGKARGLEAGADQYLTQPFESIELVAMVRGLLRLHEKEIEAREKAEALAEADRRKDDFLAMLAHELRNPLAVILTANSLLEKQALSPAGQRLSQTIGQQTQNLTRLVDDLLDVARITRGKIQLQREPLDLRALLESFVASEAPALEKTHRLSIRVPDEALWIEGDPTRIEQIVSNLVSNAVKYSEPGTKISLSLSPSRRFGRPHATLRVTDSGIGISPENLGSVFDLFFQVDATLARSQSGLGIGLTLVKRLVEMHDGVISVASRGAGYGSEFRIELPTVAPAERKGETDGGVIVPTALTLLLVDDNREACELIGMWFENEGHSVTTAHDGKEGLRLALARRYDVAIIDIGLPNVDGYEIARRVRADDEQVGPVLIALTGYGRNEDKRRALEAGFDAHLVKPIQPEKVRRLVIKLLASRRPGGISKSRSS